MKLLKKLRIIINSFFFKLLTNFLIIITVFTMFQFVIYGIYMDSLKNEIITQNRGNLDYTLARFTDMTSRIEDYLTQLYMSDDLYYLKSQETDDIDSVELLKTLKTVSSFVLNKYAQTTFITDIFIIREDYDTIICSKGSYEKEFFFNNHIGGDYYKLSNWQNLFFQDFKFKYLPSYKTKTQKPANIMPIVLKPNITNIKLMVVALVDIDELVSAVCNSSNDMFNVFYGEDLIYPQEPLMKSIKEFIASDDNYLKLEDKYVFKKADSNSHIVLIMANSIKNFQKSLNKKDVLFVISLLVSILISIILAVFFTLKFSNPVRGLIDAIESNKLGGVKHSNIRELEYIIDSMNYIKMQSDNYQSIINNNQSLIKTFLNFAGVRNTEYPIDSSIKEMLFSSDSFVAIGFIIHYRNDAIKDMDYSKTTHCLMVFIQGIINSYTKDCLSFQTSDNRFVMFASCNQESDKHLGIVKEILKKLEQEREYAYFTISLSSIYDSSLKLNAALEEANKILKWRNLSCENQVLTAANMPALDEHFHISDIQESYFINNFTSGNIEGCKELINLIMTDNYKKGICLSNFQKLAVHIVNQCIRCSGSFDLEFFKDIGTDDIYNRISYCITIDDFLNFFDYFLSLFVNEHSNKELGNDYIKDYVISYIEKHYFEDIYLDILAKKLKISSSYLSQYFKEKTGFNFVDYLNRFRIEKAKYLLLHTGEKISDICKSVGYVNENSFIRTFKKYAGITPTELRRRNIQ